MKIELSAWNQDDILSLTQYANNINVWNMLRDSFPYPYTQKNAEEWISLNLNANPTTNFSIKVDSEVAGAAGVLLKADIHCKNAEIGYWLGEPFWGKGIATEAVRQLASHIFSNFDINRIYAEIFSNNPASMKVLLKNGFHEEAIHQRAIFKNQHLLNAHIWVKFNPGN